MKKINGIAKIGMPSYPIGVNGNQPCNQCYASSDEDVTFSNKYADFLFPSWDRLQEEKALLSKTEKEIYRLREARDNGTVSSEYYEDAVSCAIFWAVESGEITTEEADRLYEKYT